jgi:hypothetical protein
VRCVSSEQNWDNDNVVRLERAAAKMLTLVSLRYNNEGNGGHRLLIDQLAEARLAPHDAIGDIASSCALHLLL